MTSPVTEWKDGVPVAGRYDDPYYSLEDGLAETRHTFLGGCGLPEGFRPGFRIAELGFGTGLNLAAALRSWREASIAGPLRYTGFEAHPMPPADLRRALAAFPDIAGEAGEIAAGWERGPSIRLPDLEAEIVIGDARATVPGWRGEADAWFLDGFAPARNPTLWEAPLLAAVAARTAPEGRLATYTAAGGVRRALADAGLEVERRRGFGRKRHMTVARRP
ncbi:tRNA U34 5-methylaminomethyl-2-thiouridine-forming methyltransferase MnmC [Hasllibacter halocynthiae]|uniref:tRNA U34 5-methylaminomethyl-2-thiouridine-forming methyltransferase MnmC n=1 Tax=Hasllibacter halocynthiae TaxID=595589 RepID=A0A2T0X3F3_9RHOB|nr:tRNA (5-methylaminomethyl-2-thiouridine)(34)-methyltransferase MnmD [Hasllibacter halocynthiae]PRY93394.1 tRNA U34 5-methylaminomethyl-2-thiouridine-forming methyltransferase MnmC [Hasllibacter halocynthiae]